MMVVLGGCALQVPEAIAEEPSNNPEFAAVLAQPNSYDGDQVRWGGTITAVEHRGDDTVLVIASRALNNQGKPLADAGSQGQFMAKVNYFLNPDVYAKGRSVTVAGTIVGSESRDIGSDPNTYPFVAVNDYYLWPEAPQATNYRYSCHRGDIVAASPYPDTMFGYGQNFHRCP
ncbi:MAG TPA: Slp family lipoprotein [Nitrococcus sp.]|nr:Slp family lipoprotein [Nitrococcus sp.]